MNRNAVSGISYWLRNKLYLSLTNECSSISPIELRGPRFIMPEHSGFQLLSREPEAEDILHVVNTAYDDFSSVNRISVSSMESDEITFAGFGEPLLRLDVLEKSSSLIKEFRHGAPLRLKTNGLVCSKDSMMIAERLKEAGIEKVSVNLLSDNPSQS